MLTLEWVVIGALALFRIARIVGEDAIAEPLRARLYRWSWSDTERVRAYDEETGTETTVTMAREHPMPRGIVRPYANALLTCPLCLGFWLAPVVYVALRWGHDLGRSIIVVLALAGLQSAVELAVQSRAGAEGVEDAT